MTRDERTPARRITHLIPETPAQRRPVTFNYEHSHPIIAGSHVIRGDRANELRIIRDAADGFIKAVKSGSREGLCSAACGVSLCTRNEHDDGIHLCVEVNVVAHAIWTEAEDGAGAREGCLEAIAQAARAYIDGDDGDTHGACGRLRAELAQAVYRLDGREYVP